MGNNLLFGQPPSISSVTPMYSNVNVETCMDLELLYIVLVTPCIGKYRAPVQACSALLSTVYYLYRGKHRGETESQGEGVEDQSSKDSSLVFSWQSIAELFVFLM